MLSNPTTALKNGKTPCCRPLSEWPICYSDACYLNRECPAYRGSRPSPVRDYIPLPPVFILVEPFEAFPFSYKVAPYQDEHHW